MIVVKLEIWPNGDFKRKINTGVMTIVNVTGDDLGLATAHYEVRLYRGGLMRDADQTVREARWADVDRSGIVTNFQRLKYGAWSLLFRGLASLQRADRVGDDIYLGPLPDKEEQ